MNIQYFRPLKILLFAIILSTAVASNAMTEYGTFESFYKLDSTPTWWLAVLTAAIGGGVIFFTGGTASPVVIAIGSWAGGLMGFTGIAATNAGLALLGGGSIASGGMGIIGGTALLTAALTFSTDVIIDYSINKAVSTYDYSKFVEISKQFPTLSLPKSRSGSALFKKAISIINKGSSNKSVHDPQIQLLISQAIDELNRKQSSGLSDNDTLRDSFV